MLCVSYGMILLLAIIVMAGAGIYTIDSWWPW